MSLATSYLPNSLHLKDVESDTIPNSVVVEEHVDVDVAVADEAGSVRRDS